MSSLLLTRPEQGIQKPDPGPKPRPYWFWLAAIWLVSGIYLVQPDQQAVVTTLGAVSVDRVSPGLHYAFPWPIDRVYKLKVHQLRRAVIGGDAADAVLGRLQPALAQFLTGDQNLINVRVVVQYSVAQPKNFLFNSEDVDRVVATTVESELAHRLAHTSVDDILTTQKVSIQNDVLESAQKALERCDAGVALASVNIENVAPPAEAAAAFRDVSGARADALRIVNEAQGYANDLLPRARGEADQIAASAQGYKDGKINRATGDAARFEAVAAEYARAPGVTSTRAYVEAMEQILPRLKKLIVDSDQDIDLTVIGRDGNRPK
jgi:membrane protease subunit HflK